MTIKESFKNYKIQMLQLDPFGVCNAKCWYCPVRYLGNPDEGKEVMSPELLEKIIKNLIDERDKEDGLVSKNFNSFFTSHYNEILLYKHFEELLQLCEKYGLQCQVLSNGVPLTPDKVDLIARYKNSVKQLFLNVPAYDAETWSKRSGINIKQFDKLISNISYAVEKLPEMVQDKSFTIGINGTNENSFVARGGMLEKGVDFPSDMDLDPYNGELAKQARLAKELFPTLHSFTVSNLIDRAGILDNVMTNKKGIEINLKNNDVNKKVIGCSHNTWHEDIGGRPFGWLHINSKGETFLCCHDYHFDYKFGSFKTQELADFWGKENHEELIQKAFDTFCKNCSTAIFE
jgi:hypothetical protein